MSARLGVVPHLDCRIEYGEGKRGVSEESLPPAWDKTDLVVPPQPA